MLDKGLFSPFPTACGVLQGGYPREGRPSWKTNGYLGLFLKNEPISSGLPPKLGNLLMPGWPEMGARFTERLQIILLAQTPWREAGLPSQNEKVFTLLMVFFFVCHHEFFPLVVAAFTRVFS